MTHLPPRRDVTSNTSQVPPTNRYGKAQAWVRILLRRSILVCPDRRCGADREITAFMAAWPERAANNVEHDR
jgi:hypothetical protein